jgi:hypothetical protein
LQGQQEKQKLQHTFDSFANYVKAKYKIWQQNQDDDK